MLGVWMDTPSCIITSPEFSTKVEKGSTEIQAKVLWEIGV